MELGDIPEIDLDTLESRLAAGAALFDVREPFEYDEVRIPGARLVPLATVPDEIDTIRAATPPAACVVCASGGRSANAVRFLQAYGIDALNVAGGTNAWLLSGRPFDSGPT